MSKKINVIMHEQTDDGLVVKHPQTNTKMVEGLDGELKSKADKSYVDTNLKAKADKSYVDGQLNIKADKSYVDGQVSPKADKSYVDGQLKVKADKTEVPKKLSDLEIDMELGKDYDKDIQELHNKTGNLSELKTEDKSSLVNAINEIVPLIVDNSGSPGSKSIKIGDGMEGYFGSVSSSQLITGDDLARKVGVTQGTAQHSTTPWHKFAYKNKILFVAQKTIRNSISWDHLNDKDVVYGNKTIEIDGVKYKVRLLKGALTDPSDYDASDKGAKGSEWNRLILPLHEERKNNSWGYPKYVEDDLQDWETYLSNSDIVVSSGGGEASWCQEVSGGSSAHRVNHGSFGVSFLGTRTSPSAGSYLGWRPVLEVI